LGIGIGLVAIGVSAGGVEDDEKQPLTAGAAADVIAAYAKTHGGRDPDPALVKQIIMSTANDLEAPANQQGAGLLDVLAAVRESERRPGFGPVVVPDLPVVVLSPPPCLAEQAAVAAARAAEAAARLEFEAAKAALDEAERKNNLGQTEESYQALRAAANRQGAGRLNLEIAEKHLREANQALAACLGSGLPVEAPPVVLTPPDTVLHPAGVVPGMHMAGEVPPDLPPVTVVEIPPVVLTPPDTVVHPGGVVPGVHMAGDPCATQRAAVAAAQAALEQAHDTLSIALEFPQERTQEASSALGKITSGVTTAEYALSRAQQALDLCEAEHPTPSTDDETPIEIG